MEGTGILLKATPGRRTRYPNGSVQWSMDRGRTIAISTLQSLIYLDRGEENRLRAILADAPKFMLKMKVRADLDKCRRKIKLASEELARLQAE